MYRKALPFVAPVLLFALAGSTPKAGGWAVITIENLPSYLEAGKEYELTYSVRHHGIQLRDSLKGRVVLKSSGDVVESIAGPGKTVGEYTAFIVAPESGAWLLKVESTVFPWFDDLVVTSQEIDVPVVSSGEAPSTIYTPAERGHRIYLAKGCWACHKHANVARSGEVPVGPDLSEAGYAPDYLRAFLADPTIRPPTDKNWPMPDLGLNQDEISDLIAFLTSESD